MPLSDTARGGDWVRRLFEAGGCDGAKRTHIRGQIVPNCRQGRTPAVGALRKLFDLSQ